MKRTDLIEAAEDLNKLDFDDPIDTGLSIPDLKEQVKSAALWLYATDEIEENTVEILKQLDWTEDDFKGLKKKQDPLPAFYRWGILSKEEEPEPEPKPVKAEESRKKPVKPKTQKKKTPVSEEVSEAEEPTKEEIHAEEQHEAGKYSEEPEEHIGTSAPKKAPKPKREGPSAYGTAIALLGPDPNIGLHNLYDMMRDQGFDLAEASGSIKTAHSIFRKVYKTLDAHGHIVKKEST